MAKTPYKQFKVSGPKQRVKLIERQIRRAVHGPEMPVLRKLVIQDMLGSCRGQRNDMCDLNAIYAWWRRHLPYIPDPTGLDLYPTPLQALRLGGEDCDGHVIAVGASLAMVGFPVGVRVIKTAASGWHVYGLAGTPRESPARWIPWDTTWERAAGPGDEYPAGGCTYRKSWALDLR